MQTIVSIDLETTGLDSESDSIIEVGAIRFVDGRVEDEWNTLVNPGRPLSPFITQLTGISDSMLAGSPRILEILDDLEEFIGDDPLLGHNIRFDAGFLRRNQIAETNLLLDTYDLASILLPTQPRYDLASLANSLGVPILQHHRALEDARMTMHVYLRLLEFAREQPYEIMAELARLGEEVEWGAGWIIEEVISGMSDETELKISLDDLGWKTADEEEIWAPDIVLDPQEEPSGLNEDEVASPLEPGGAFAKAFPEYEHRPQQIMMLRAVSEAFSTSDHLLVEAGTGTGKSMAYLLPAAAWAIENEQRVVISTNTINLQDQLIHKDIPDLKLALDVDVRAATLKGRRNYVCPRRLTAMRTIGPRNADEMRVLAKVLIWLANGGSGDRSEITLRGPMEAVAWSRLSSDSEDCSAETCLGGPDHTCPYYRARVRADAAHIIVVNHSLLLADVAIGGRVIPEYNYLVVDEAHHLESATTNGLTFQVSERELLRSLRDLGQSRNGVLAPVMDSARRELSSNTMDRLEKYAQELEELSKDCSERTSMLFLALTQILELRREGDSIGPFGQQERITGATRKLPIWGDFEVAWDNLRTPLGALTTLAAELSDNISDLSGVGLEDAEELSIGLRSVARNLNEIFHQLDAMIFEPDSLTIYWAGQRQGDRSASLHSAPLEVGPLVEQFLWHEKESVVMTSATLTTGGEFDYIRQRLNAFDASELALGSPFDYESSTMLFLINDIPEPTSSAGFQRGVESGLLALARATQGRMMALFTSYSQLRRTSRAISRGLQEDNILLLEQGEGSSRHGLLETFRNTENAVLFGTRSFWEGVDIPGDALSVLALIRVPFDVPSDPVIAARAETYESPFDQYTVPEAILRFRQGFGRLIRTASDRGVVVTFDSRLVSKNYGRAFVESLPRCTLRTGRLSELPEAASRWLGI